jgi:centromere/kinetochore protein ZW10
MATADPPAAHMAQALVDFSVHGAFPEEGISSLPLDAESLPTAIKALADAKAKLQVRAHTRWEPGAC